MAGGAERVERVWIVRHGQTEYNLLPRSLRLSAEAFNLIVRQSESSQLTPEGCEQIERLVEQFRGRPLAAVYSSPLLRALSSAQILADLLRLPVVPVEGLREFVPTEVKPLFFLRCHRTLRCWYLHSMARQFLPGFSVTETFWQARARMKNAWRELVVGKAPGDTGGVPERLVMAHRGTVIILRWAFRWDRRWRVIRSNTENGGITEITRC